MLQIGKPQNMTTRPFVWDVWEMVTIGIIGTKAWSKIKQTDDKNEKWIG